MFTEFRYGSVKWRILLELAGRERPIRIQELCETLELEPGKAKNAIRDLYLNDRVERSYLRGDVAITWQGRDALGRLSDQHDRIRQHWWYRRRFNIIWWTTGAVLIYIISLLIHA